MKRTEPNVRGVRWTVGIIMISWCIAYLWALSTWRIESSPPDSLSTVVSSSEMVDKSPIAPPRAYRSSESLLLVSADNVTSADAHDVLIPTVAVQPSEPVIVPLHGLVLSEAHPQEERDTGPEAMKTEELSTGYQRALQNEGYWEQHAEIVDEVPSRRIVQWPRPDSLIAHIEHLSEQPELSTWAFEVLLALEELSSFALLTGEGPDRVMGRLADLIDQSDDLKQELSSDALQSDLGRARYSLSRRLVLWTHVQDAADAQWASAHDEEEPLDVAARIDAVDQLLQGTDAWRDYLLIDKLVSLATEDSTDSLDTRKTVARQVMGRITKEDLTVEQSHYLQEAEIVALSAALRHWAAEPVSLLSLLCDLETYESTLSPTAARRIVSAQASLKVSPIQELRDVAECLDRHYRNANVRVAMTSEFLNRLLPQVDQVNIPVSDQILGARVRGRSAATTELHLRLVPDNDRARIQLEANGRVQSRTRSFHGPIVFFNDGRSTYHAESLLLIDPDGIRVWRSRASANSSDRVRDIQTDYDAVPLLGNLVRGFAKSQYDDQRHGVRLEVEHRISQQAARRFDEEINSHISRAHDRVQNNVINPLDDLQLDPTAIDMRTTSDQLIMRWRLAGEKQLAAFTARLCPPANTLMQIQLHQSALNNTVKQLGLDGRSSDLRELYVSLANCLGYEDATAPDDLPEKVAIQFADEESVKVQCEGGRVTLTLNIARLDSGRRHWRDFTIRAYYEPVIDRLHARLVRQTSIELIGQDLRLRDQIALRSIFTKALSRNHPLELIHSELADRTELADLAITQFVVRNGWIGIALGPDAELASQPTSISR